MILNMLNKLSIRARLLLATVGILVIGFAVLTFVAGSQIAAAARADYENQLLNTIKLVVRGVSPYVSARFDTENLSTEVEQIITEFEEEIGGTITFVALDGGGHNNPPSRSSFRDLVEVETAIRGEIVIVERDDTLYTAANITPDNRQEDFTPVVIQLAVPLDRLNELIIQRWVVLIVVFVGVLAVSLAAALLVSQSIIKPLYALRESAVRLSQGELNHRIQLKSQNEIGAVATAFNEMAFQVQSMLEEQRAFASNTSHELRTPLTTIRLRSESMRYDDLDEDVVKQYIEEIDDEVKHLATLVEDLTLLSRFDAGRAELGSSEIDMRRFIMSMQHQFEAQLTQHGITLSTTITDEILPIKASLNHLNVIFRNLLDNAIKYTPSGGNITWTTSMKDNIITSVIQDTGQGIDEKNLPHIFERFYRADKARSREVPGTGLGLAMVRSIIHAYGGTITIESPGINQGTKVTVCFPN